MRRLVEETYREEFEKLYDLLTEYNNSVNLTSITKKNEVFLKHFLDSVAGEKYLVRGAEAAEIGSGGGFPSLPLKIVRRDVGFTLIESTGKKCRYLERCVDKLALDGVKVENMRAEDGGRDQKFREKYDAAVARAVAPLNTLCEYCLPYVKKGGVFVAYKGECGDELKQAERAICLLGGRTKEVETYTLPNGDRRSLVVIEKEDETPLLYPRGRGKERKYPL